MKKYKSWTQRIRDNPLVTDQRPTVDGWAQIGTLGMRSFVILPLEQALLRHGLLKGEEHDLLFGELENRLGVNLTHTTMPVAQ
jgi:hypothetical protein